MKSQHFSNVQYINKKTHQHETLYKMECSTYAANHVEYSKVEPLQKSVFTEGSTLIFSYCSIKDLHAVTRSKRKKNFRLVVDWLVSAQHCKKKNASSCNCFRFDLQLWNSNDWSKGSYMIWVFLTTMKFTLNAGVRVKHASHNTTCAQHEAAKRCQDASCSRLPLASILSSNSYGMHTLDKSTNVCQPQCAAEGLIANGYKWLVSALAFEMQNTRSLAAFYSSNPHIDGPTNAWKQTKWTR